MSRSGLAILMYHAIDTSGNVTSTDPGWFAETLAALIGSGFRAVDLDDWIARGRPAVERSFAVTFDDGLRSIGRAADLLKRYRVPATAFLVTDRMGSDNAWPGQPRSVGRSPLLDWSDLADLHESGFHFGAHTRSHPRLDRLDAASLDHELRGSRDAIEERLGQACRLLASPYGIAPARVRLAASRHFAAAFSTRLDYASAADDRHAIARIDAYYLRTPRALEKLISGRWRLGVRRALRGARRAVIGMTDDR